jgi:plasmid stabilization system protein ParE
MTFLVEITRRADEDLNEIYRRIHAADSPLAARWFNGLEEAINSLETFPARGSAISSTRLRQLLYGSKPDVYRIVYSVDAKQCQVNVLYVRHGARSVIRSSRFH